MPRSNEEKIQRCQLIMDLISNKLYNLNDLIIEVNKKFKASNRTIDADIKALKDGILGVHLPLKFTREGVYRIDYDDLHNYGETDCRHIPVLTKLIEPFKNLPDVEDTVQKLKQKYAANMKTLDELNNVFEFTSTNITHDPMVLKLTQEIIGHMIQGVGIEFNYYGVHQPNKNEDKLHRVFPLQIRELHNRYYLIAVTINSNPQINKLVTYAFEEIKDMKIGSAMKADDPNENQPERYNHKELMEKIEFDKKYEHAIGVWIKPTEGPKLIERYFAGWAASHILACPIHKSQKLLSDIPNVTLNHIIDNRTGENLINRVIKVSWEIYKTPELQYRLGAYREYSWNTNDYNETGPDKPINWKF